MWEQWLCCINGARPGSLLQAGQLLQIAAICCSLEVIVKLFFCSQEKAQSSPAIGTSVLKWYRDFIYGQSVTQKRVMIYILVFVCLFVFEIDPSLGPNYALELPGSRPDTQLSSEACSGEAFCLWTLTTLQSPSVGGGVGLGWKGGPNWTHPSPGLTDAPEIRISCHGGCRHAHTQLANRTTDWQIAHARVSGELDKLSSVPPPSVHLIWSQALRGQCGSITDLASPSLRLPLHTHARRHMHRSLKQRSDAKPGILEAETRPGWPSPMRWGLMEYNVSACSICLIHGCSLVILPGDVCQ